MLLTALILLAAAALVSSLGGRARASAALEKAASSLAWLLCIAASVVLVVAGGLGLTGAHNRLGLGGFTAGLGAAGLGTDRLSALFLVIAFGVAVPVLCAAAAPAHRPRGRLAAAVAMTLAAVEIIITADHLFVLLFGWEGLTFAFYLLAGYDRARAGRDRAAIVTAVFGKLSGAALLVGGLLVAVYAHSFSLTDVHVTAAHTSGLQIAYVLLLVAFAVKVGVVPLQIWLPVGYAAAPGPARAVMAGVAVNVGFYGMWRTLHLLGAPPVWLICVVLILAGITAILGIAHAAVHADLMHLIAWSSVENAGLIGAGYGVGLVGSAAHDVRLVAAGLVAGTAQIVAHALGKSLLFVSASGIEQACGTTRLDRLGGIVKKVPWSGTGLVIGSLTLAGLPLTAGFASEWFTLESLMQQFRVSSLALQLSTAGAAALVALSVGVAAVTFVRVIALTAFGPSRTGAPPLAPIDHRADRQASHRLGVALLSLVCLGAAAFAPFLIRLIATGLRPLVGRAAHHALAASTWVLQPVYDNFSALSPSWLWIALPMMSVILWLIAWAISGREYWHIRRVDAWSSGSPGVDRGIGYTSSAYANPMRQVLGNVLLTKRELRQVPTPAEGRGSMTYRIEVIEIVDRFLYQPLLIILIALVRVAKRMQSGRLDAYMAYMLLAVLAVLAVVIAAR